MKIENQVTRLELSKELKELGVEQDSVFNWFDISFPTKPNEIHLSTGSKLNCSNDFINFVNYSAFTTAELGEKLPQTIKIRNITYQLFISMGLDRQWFVVYANEHDYHDNTPIKIMMCHNEADAKAKCLIWLIKNNYIKKENL